MRPSKTKGAAQRRADRYLSYYIRQRDADEGGTAACCTCGRLLHWTEGHAGHFVRRGRQATRYDERNVNFQDRGCNTFRGGREWEHGAFIDRQHGVGTAEDLKRLGETIQKTSRVYFDEIAEKFRGLIVQNGWVLP